MDNQTQIMKRLNKAFKKMKGGTMACAGKKGKKMPMKKGK